MGTKYLSVGLLVVSSSFGLDGSEVVAQQTRLEVNPQHTRISLDLKGREAEQVVAALQPFLDRDDVQLLTDSRNQRLIVEGPAASVEKVSRLLALLDQKGAPTSPPPSPNSPLTGSGNQATILNSGPAQPITRLPMSGSGSPSNLANNLPPIGQGESTNEKPAANANRWLYVSAQEQPLVEKRLAELLAEHWRQAGTGHQWRSARGNRQLELNLQFDSQREELRITGDAQLVPQMVSLVQHLQTELNQRPGTNRVRLVHATRSTAAYLQQIKKRIAAGPAQLSATPGAAGNSSIRPVSFLSPVLPQDAAPALEAPAQEASMDSAQTQDERPTLPDFGGNIDVEMLPDLDVLILRGRDQDLQQLADIVRQLEAISAKTQPEVEVYHLQHSSAGALASVLAQVNPELIGGRQGRITVTSIEKPNALLLIGWGDAVKATKDLIAELDQPVDPSTQFRVFRLKNATAATVQQTLQQFLGERAGLATRARIFSDQRTNSLVVAAAPRDMEEVSDLIRELDVSEGMARNRAEVVQPKHMLASDLAETLRLTINAIQQGDSRSGILELLTIDEDGAETIRSGALRDVTITAQPRNNSILISAPPHSINLLKSLIDQLDQPTSTAQMKIFRIVHSDAGSIVQVLRSLLPSETAAGQPYRLPNTGEATSLVPLRFSIDTRTNSVLAIGNPEDLAVVEALVLRLDEQGGLERKSVVYHLKNAPARDIAAAINEFLVNQRQLNLASPGSTNPYQQLEQEVIIVPEPVGNRLILSATSRYFDEISQLIQKLDEAPPQVMIQVLIAEVTLNNADEFGVELGIQDSVLFDRSLLGDLLTTVNTTSTSNQNGVVTLTEEIVQSATNVPGFNFNSTSDLGNSGSDKSLATSKDVGGQGISNFSVGRVSSEVGFGGLVLSASGRNVSALLRALQESRRLEILSRPQIRSLDNQPAYIQVGQRVPRIIGSTVNQNGQTNTVALENVGLIMGVTPRISPDGTVVMEVDAEKSQLGPESEGIPVSVSSDGTVIRSPRIDTTTAQTTVSAASGETIVLGGLITKSTQEVHRKVPWLGDLPIVRNLFRFDSNYGKRTELVIILTPHVIRSPIDSDRIREIELARMSWCAADVYEIHGDVHMGSDYFDLDADTEIVYPDGRPEQTPDYAPLIPLDATVGSGQ